ncbi:carbohydrate kinase [uncultured Clostridium sp.]|uniref:carbohydrate kinase family protein n=1 Tax=uncultured Clostridium sp. TaxID=59620 RepID=UPI0028E950DF|nr:carbohydrate kinase [uncultured Clostridium sp.]
MAKLYAIGEVLIDFISNQKQCKLKDVAMFEKAFGGAPANVAIAVARYGGDASMITQVGEDAFGDFLIETLASNGVNTSYIKRTTEANTGLAFVSVQANGERDFSFFRNPSADLLLKPTDIKKDWFERGDYLHFCSVDLVESPMKEAHKQTIRYVKEKNGLISFDPNVRLSLWDDPNACKEAIQEFLPFADIVKISDEELTFITGEESEEKALESLFVGDVKIVVYTKGANGAMVLTKEKSFQHPGYRVEVEDTTGAGDAFIGSFLYKLISHKVTKEQLISFIHENAHDVLSFSNAGGALTTSGRGAIGALPTREQVEKFI